jgi:ABC-2 type transport system ATP-binding protein
LEGVVRVQIDGRTASVFASSNADGVVDRGRELHAKSIDVTPVSLKEIFLENLKQGEDHALV